MAFDVLDQEQQTTVTTRIRDRFEALVQPVLEAAGDWQMLPPDPDRFTMQATPGTRVWWLANVGRANVESTVVMSSTFEPPRVGVVCQDIEVTDTMTEDDVVDAVATALTSAVQARLDGLDVVAGRSAGRPVIGVSYGVRTKCWSNGTRRWIAAQIRLAAAAREADGKNLREVR